MRIVSVGRVLAPLLVLAALGVSPLAHAQEADAAVSKEIPHLDIGVSTGLNNPGGLYGLELEYRLLDWVSVGLGGGSGAWGWRLTPQARLYPFGASKAGLFLELGSSLNFGGESSVTINGDRVQSADQLLTPTFNSALGYRFQLGRHGWLAPRLGYSFGLRKDNVSVEGNQEIDPLLGTALALSQPGGFIVGLTGGIAIF